MHYASFSHLDVSLPYNDIKTTKPITVFCFPSPFLIAKATRFSRWRIDSFFFISDKREPTRERRSTLFFCSFVFFLFASCPKGSSRPVTVRIHAHWTSWGQVKENLRWFVDNLWSQRAQHNHLSFLCIYKERLNID